MDKESNKMVLPHMNSYPFTYTGWALNYVKSEKSIPETWRSEFYDELVNENLEYRRTLENAIHLHGVRWAK